MGSNSSTNLNHPDLQRTRIRKDESDVCAFEELMEKSWINPLSLDQLELVNLSTGVLAPPDVAKDLLEAHQLGEGAYESFRRDRLEKDPPSAKFHDKMKKQKLKTFVSIKKKSTGKVQGKEIVLKADKNLFGHIIMIAQSRELPLQEVLSHPLGPLPWSLANADASLRKTNKAALARELEKNVQPAEVIPGPSACIIDGMALVHRLKGDGKTFEELADSALKLALHEGSNSKRIDVVFDVYRDTSIKNAERCNRGSSMGTQWKNIAPGHKVVQWKKFLRTSENKVSLIKFLTDQWKQPEKREKLEDKLIFVTCEESCYMVTREHWDIIQALTTNQEEADTRMLLHAAHAADEGYRSVIITAEDTDVLILCICFSKKLGCEIYIKSGTLNRTRYIDVCRLAKTLGDDMCKALLALHAFTGCDTVSCFAGRGKLVPLKILKGNTTFQQCFMLLGENWDISPDIFEKIQEFVCRIYISTSAVSNVNELRYQLFCAKRGDIDSSQLPPCRDCLYVHTLRANFQAGIWRRCLEGQANIPDPKNCGWTSDDGGNLSIEWMRGSPAPDAVLQMLSCKCTRVCKLPDCVCLVNQMKCTYMCKLQSCTNQKDEDAEENDDIEIDEADTDDDESFSDED